jgi:hypothetical protein
LLTFSRFFLRRAKRVFKRVLQNTTLEEPLERGETGKTPNEKGKGKRALHHNHNLNRLNTT